MSSSTGTSAQSGGCDEANSCPSRRAVLLGVAAAGGTVALAGCQTYGEQVANQPISTLPPATEPAVPGDGSTTGPAEPPEDEQPGGEVLANLSDIPVGGGVVFAAQGVVVTVPKEGTVKAYTDNCTHAGCKVNQVSGGTINCPCHGSKFKVADGSVASGPARRPLEAVKVTVDGDSIRLA